MKFLKNNFLLIVVLLAIFFLRLPSFWEPYWYGDEGIYLAIGQALQRGSVLYRDIWDNKPPLLYLIYALSPTLLWAKVSATIFVLGTCIGFYLLSKKVFSSIKLPTVYSLLSTAVVGILLSLPLLEGTIANAELYFTLPIVLGSYLIYKQILAPSRSLLAAILIGFLFTAAFLIKIPAVFDFAGLFLAFSIITLTQSPIPNLITKAKSLTTFFLPVAITFLIPIVFLIAYFYSNHGLSDFLTASFSQNVAYVSVDTGPLSKLTNPLFIKALILLISLVLLILLFLKKWISKELLFLSLWFGFSLYGALLSGRPYMHYLLQIVPPGVLLLVYLIVNLRRYWILNTGYWILLFLVARMFHGAFSLPILPYYQNWFDYVSERKTWDDYVNFFDSRTLNSYRVAEYLIQNTEYSDHIFVWGDASFVYVLSNRPPATKFIQAHHLTTIDPKNYDLVIQKLKEVKPKYILIFRPGHFPFPKLEELLKETYSESASFNDLHVYAISDNL